MPCGFSNMPRVVVVALTLVTPWLFTSLFFLSCARSKRNLDFLDFRPSAKIPIHVANGNTAMSRLRPSTAGERINVPTASRFQRHQVYMDGNIHGHLAQL